MYDDHALARALAEMAGARLLELRATRGFGDPRALRAAGDQLSHRYLADELARLRPDDAVLSEESAESRTDQTRLAADRVWIIDPLDGTREFGEEGRGDWAVHVALWQRGELVAGAVALPAQDMTLSTTAGGATRGHGIALRTGDRGAGNGQADQAASAFRADGATGFFQGDGSTEVGGAAGTAGGHGAGAVRIAVSRSRPPEFVTRLTDHLRGTGMDIELVPIGSAGAKISAVLLGAVEAYVHAGGQYEWDSAAPAAVALAAGAHASRIDGSPLTYNQKDIKLPDILVCLPELAATLLAGIGDVTSAAHDAEE